jgi:hypothetical protein
LFSEEQIRKLSGSSINYLAGGTLEHLLEWGQAVIINKADYIKNLDEDIKDENEDMFGLSDIDWSELRKG